MTVDFDVNDDPADMEVVESEVEIVSVEEGGETSGGENEASEVEENEDGSDDESSGSDATWDHSMEGKSEAQIKRELMMKKRAIAMAEIEKDQSSFMKNLKQSGNISAQDRAKIRKFEDRHSFLKHMDKLSDEKLKSMDFDTVFKNFTTEVDDGNEAVEEPLQEGSRSSSPVEPEEHSPVEREPPSPEPVATESPTTKTGTKSMAPPPSSVPEKMNLRTTHSIRPEVGEGSGIQSAHGSMPTIPPEAYRTQEEMVESLEEERAEAALLKKDKRIISEEMKRMKTAVLSSLQMFEDDDPLEGEEIADEVQMHFDVILDVASANLTKDKRELVKSSIGEVSMIVQGLHSKIGTIREEMTDLQMRYAAACVSIEADQNLKENAAMWLRMKNPFEFRPGEPFDRHSEEFRASMEEFIRRGGSEDSAYDLDCEEVQAVQRALAFVKRRRLNLGEEPDVKSMMYPKVAVDLANNWRGVHHSEMNTAVLDSRAKDAKECFTVICDESVKDPTTGEPVEYKYIHENVWMPVESCNDIFKSMMAESIKVDYTKLPLKNRDWALASFNGVAVVIVDAFFSGGVSGAELANLYTNHVIPSTAKKLRAIRRLVRSIVAYLIFKKSGTAEEYRSTENSVMMAITRLANRQRHFRTIHLDRDGNPLKMPKGGDTTKKWLISSVPGPKKPGQFLRFFDEAENLKDDFVRDIIDNEHFTKDPVFVEAMKLLKFKGGLPKKVGSKKSRKRSLDENDDDEEDDGEENDEETTQSKDSVNQKKTLPSDRKKYTWARKPATKETNPAPVSLPITPRDKNHQKKVEMEKKKRRAYLDVLAKSRQKNRDFLKKKNAEAQLVVAETVAGRKKALEHATQPKSAKPKARVGKGTGKTNKRKSSADDDEDEDSEVDVDAPPPPKTMKTRKPKA